MPTTVVSFHSHVPYDIYVGRSTDPNTGRQTTGPMPDGTWGNCFTHFRGAIAKYHVKTKIEAIRKHAEYLNDNPYIRRLVKEQLKDKVLMCHCTESDIAQGMCHAVTLAKIANEPERKSEGCPA